MKNEKRRISAARREENESEISREEYLELIRSADPARRTIIKTRYCVPVNGLTAEVDVFSGMTEFAVCEVELPSEDAPFALPDFLTVIREVTDDPRFTNAAMALVCFAFAVVLLWLAVWFAIWSIGGLVRGIIRLGRKWCYKEAAE